MQFLGVVRLLQVVGNEHVAADGSRTKGGGHRIATVSVTEDFSGQFEPGQIVEVTTGLGGGDCGYPFREGETYLLDVVEREGDYTTGICMRTTAAATAGVVLHELRTLATGHRIPDVSGSVVHYSVDFALEKRPVPVSDVPVTLTGLDGTVLKSTTGPDGVFEVDRVPLGAYAVSYQLPAGLMTRAGEDIGGVAVPFTTAVGAGCEIGLSVYSAGRLQGRVQNLQGDGVPGFVYVYPNAARSQGPIYTSSSVRTKADGSFEIAPLDEGAYVVSFVPKTGEKLNWYYPGTRQKTEARPVLVQEGNPHVC